MAIEVSEDIRRNFHLFWDNFPAAVLLVHKDRTIVDMNAMAKEVGYPLGSRCCDLGKPEDHRACLAGHALRDKESKRLVMYYDPTKQVLDSYWIPLAGAEDYYVHFATDITAWAAGRLFPEKNRHGAGGCGCGGEHGGDR